VRPILYDFCPDRMVYDEDDHNDVLRHPHWSDRSKDSVLLAATFLHAGLFIHARKFPASRCYDYLWSTRCCSRPANANKAEYRIVHHRR